MKSENEVRNILPKLRIEFIQDTDGQLDLIFGRAAQEECYELRPGVWAIFDAVRSGTLLSISGFEIPARIEEEKQSEGSEQKKYIHELLGVTLCERIRKMPFQPFPEEKNWLSIEISPDEIEAFRAARRTLHDELRTNPPQTELEKRAATIRLKRKKPKTSSKPK